MDKDKKVTTLVDNINKQKDIFLSKLTTLKSQKEYTGEFNISMIKNIFRTKDKEKNKHLDIFNNKESENKDKNTKMNIIGTFTIIGVLTVNFLFSTTFFRINNHFDFNSVNEQMVSIIYRSIKSPHTEVLMKSKYDESTNSIVEFYQVIDKLDSYTYNLTYKDVDKDLHSKLLETIENKSKPINTLEPIKNKYESITKVNENYIINSKYKIHNKNLSENDALSIKESIKHNNIKAHNVNKIINITSSFILCTLLEIAIASRVIKQRNNKEKNSLS